jgi:two-component sensor histidine kinase
LLGRRASALQDSKRRVHMIRVFERPGLGYLLAVSSFLAACWLRFELNPVLPTGFPYLTFFPAVILTTFLAGLWPGVLCAVLCGLAAWGFFIPPEGFAISGEGALALGFYVFIVAVDIALIHVMRRAVGRLEAQTRLNAELYDRQRVLFQELQHRVANNMTFVASLLNMKRRSVASPEAAAALDEARDRLWIMAGIHRRLHDPLALDRPTQEHLTELCDDLARAAGGESVVCRVTSPDLKLDLERLVALSLLVTEVVTNSLKHAFEGREGGEIHIEVERLGPEVAVTIRDDGPGLPPGQEAGEGAGLGQAIIRSLAAQLQGRLEFPRGEGAVTRIVFAA